MRCALCGAQKHSGLRGSGMCADCETTLGGALADHPNLTALERPHYVAALQWIKDHEGERALAAFLASI